jgi:hypothetical protein
MKKLAIIIFAFLVPKNLNAQAIAGSNPLVASSINVAYNASIIYPGIRAGIEYPVKQIDFTRYRKHKPALKRVKTRMLTAELGYYHHATFHDNIYLLFGYQMRRFGKKKWFSEFSPSLGYSRTFLGGETYVVDDHTGVVHLKKLAGYNYAILALGGGLGYVYSPKTSGYLRASLLTMFPSNNYVYLRPTLELGAILKLPDFLKAHQRMALKSKGKKR